LHLCRTARDLSSNAALKAPDPKKQFLTVTAGGFRGEYAGD